MKIVGLTKIEKLKLVGLMIKSVTAIVGGSLIISEGHPYIAVSILAVGGAANEFVSFIKEKENQATISSLQEENEDNNTDNNPTT